MKRMTDEQVEEKLKNVPGWKFSENKINKEFELSDFKSAMEFVNKVGDEAENLDHHPDILMHSWNKVKISVNTHTEGGVTEKDFTLASKIEDISI